jgi:excisionase family DNA binding protein
MGNLVTGGGSQLPRLYTIDEFRHLLRVSRMTFYRLMRTGAIPAPFRIGNQWRFRADDIDQWFESKKKSTQQ